jgi:hypothetical protein
VLIVDISPFQIFLIFGFPAGIFFLYTLLLFSLVISLN